MKCLNIKQIFDYCNRTLIDKENKEIQKHLQECQQCKNKLLLFKRFYGSILSTQQIGDSTPTKQCYDENDHIAYLTGHFSGKRKKQYFTHLSQCELCLSKLIIIEEYLHELKSERLIGKNDIREHIYDFISSHAKDFVTGVKSLFDRLTKPQPGYRWAGLAVIIIVLCMVLVQSDISTFNPFVTRESTEQYIVPEIKLISPKNNCTVGNNNFKFQWQDSPDIKNYVFLLLDSDGHIIMNQKTSKNKLKLPENIKLVPKTNYFWQIEGLTKNGATITSDMFFFKYEKK
ncbi:hypothetical protein JXQ31_13550 [candidate division KSB1 bacterium]|nr:hypothetical protein [candidate division KSB1 bacterium]